MRAGGQQLTGKAGIPGLVIGHDMDAATYSGGAVSPAVFPDTSMKEKLAM